jgi:hypothetical protein
MAFFFREYAPFFFTKSEIIMLFLSGKMATFGGGCGWYYLMRFGLPVGCRVFSVRRFEALVGKGAGFDREWGW